MNEINRAWWLLLGQISQQTTEDISEFSPEAPMLVTSVMSERNSIHRYKKAARRLETAAEGDKFQDDDASIQQLRQATTPGAAAIA